MRKVIFLLILTILAVSGLNARTYEIIDFTANDMKGDKIKLSDFNDKVVILDFWATWCGPCRREIPNLIDIKNTFKDENFEIISIALERGSSEKAVRFVKENKMNWVHIVNKEQTMELANKYQISYIPTMYVIKNGKIVAAGLTGAALKRKIKELL
ncbi:MAG: TlpA disulfide reductase family protein [Candidatus Aminicenantes bacterium]